MLITLLLFSSCLLGNICFINLICIIPESLMLMVTDTGTRANRTTGCGNCVFPFIYNNRESDRCTTVDGSSPFCATSVDSSGNLLTSEYCTDPSCPGLSASNSPPMTVHPENEAGKCCKFITKKVFLLFSINI